MRMLPWLLFLVLLTVSTAGAAGDAGSDGALALTEAERASITYFDSFRTAGGTLVLTEAERAFLQAHPVIRVSNELDWPPYDYFENGRPQGYSVDLMRLLAARIGVEFEFVQGESWDALVDLFCAGRIDLLQPADKPRKLLDCATFSPPIVRGANQFLTRRDHPRVRSIADLFGSVAASPRGWEQTELLKKRFGDTLRIIETANISEAIAAVSRGQADFTTDFANVLNHHIAHSGYVDLKVQGVWSREDKGGEFSALYIATRKDWPVLQSIIDKALASLTPDQIRRLQDRWFGEAGDPGRARFTLTPAARLSPAQGHAQDVRRSRLDARGTSHRGGRPRGHHRRCDGAARRDARHQDRADTHRELGGVSRLCTGATLRLSCPGRSRRPPGAPFWISRRPISPSAR
jgi:ABC-type amino acid transport substrate-binding protein